MIGYQVRMVEIRKSRRLFPFRQSLAALTMVIAIGGWMGSCIGQERVPAKYDPLNVSDNASTKTLEFSMDYPEGKREVPVRIYLPDAKSSSTKLPVILFSHGLGGSREAAPHIGQHWAKRGYCAIFMQHPGSDSNVWKDAKMGERMKAMNSAANAENFVSRNNDVKMVIDRLVEWQASPKHAPAECKAILNQLDLDRIGMSGHSFGAITTQAVSGQKFPLGRGFTDSRIKAAVILSPSSPKAGNVERAFGSVTMPWLLMTGTKDTSPIGNTDVASRLAVYPALPSGDKYELVLFNATHAFPGERTLAGDQGNRNPNHTKAVLGISTAFWDTYLRNDVQAKNWLQGDGPRSILESEDTWKHK